MRLGAEPSHCITARCFSIKQKLDSSSILKKTPQFHPKIPLSESRRLPAICGSNSSEIKAVHWMPVSEIIAYRTVFTPRNYLHQNTLQPCGYKTFARAEHRPFRKTAQKPFCSCGVGSNRTINVDFWCLFFRCV